MLTSRREYLWLMGLAAVPMRGWAQSDADKVAAMRKLISSKIELTQVAPHVSMISGAGGNIGVVTGPEGKVVIDSGLVTATPDVLRTLKKVDAQPLKYLLNTHWHFDHTEGNAQLHAAGATIVAHTKTRERLSTPQEIEFVKLRFPAATAAALPTRTLTDSFTFFHNSEEILLQHVPPAHTDSDLYVHLKQANVIHAGDLFFNGAYPIIDYSSGGTVNGYVDAMAKLLEVAGDDTKIIPGHGPLASKADLTAAHDMLAALRDAVSSLKQSGKSLADVVAAKPSAKFDEKWGKGMMSGDSIVTLIYKTLA